MTTAKLTQDLVDKGLQCPADKRRIELCDTVKPGLYVEVRQTSSEGTYYLRHKVEGKTRHEKLGRTSELSLAEARERAQTRRAELQLEKDGPEDSPGRAIDLDDARGSSSSTNTCRT